MGERRREEGQHGTPKACAAAMADQSWFHPESDVENTHVFGESGNASGATDAAEPHQPLTGGDREVVGQVVEDGLGRRDVVDRGGAAVTPRSHHLGVLRRHRPNPKVVGEPRRSHRHVVVVLETQYRHPFWRPRPHRVTISDTMSNTTVAAAIEVISAWS